MSNAQLIETHARAGCVGVVGGNDRLNRAIRQMQMGVKRGAPRSLWSHAFIFSGRRIDGQHWVLESDLDFHRKQIRLGVQENRASRYFDEEAYPNLAILDFGLDEASTQRVLSSGLDLLAGLTRYSLRELLGTVLAVARPSLRGRENLLAREGSLYCSAMVQHCYAAAGIEFAAGVSKKNTTPEDIARTSVPHQRYEILRCRDRAAGPSSGGNAVGGQD